VCHSLIQVSAVFVFKLEFLFAYLFFSVLLCFRYISGLMFTLNCTEMVFLRLLTQAPARTATGEPEARHFDLTRSLVGS